ncbi:hypothetical protein HCQ94_01240 [Actinomyces sp. zg-332]|uniref:hypothetical protein n=1 Tax=Actinomyces sp. zg-332 TaxID=2708340 RepID=UPI00141E6AC1|nr:hypothetical protein [Actinomyces sp. zg-332]QPK94363.1 hypothetical protein HCQ94_01240 [Actinomyces sp. zg-332]
MRKGFAHFLEILAYSVVGSIGIIRFISNPELSTLVMFTIAACVSYIHVFYLLDYDSLPEYQQDIYRNNVATLVVAGIIIFLYKPASFVIGGLLLLIAFAIFVRSFILKEHGPIKRGERSLWFPFQGI